jgi:hypothetical protein
MSKTPGLIVPYSYVTTKERGKIKICEDSKDNDWCKRQKVIDEFQKKQI